MRAKFELPEKLHVTLAFLGSVESENVAELQERLRAAVAEIAPFTARLDTLGGFPNERRARIVWAGSSRGDERFAQLAGCVRDAARAFATLDEKQAVLHVTLARLREPSRLPRVQLPPHALRIDAVVLYESLPGENTSRYEVVERFPLTVHASSPDTSR